MSEPRNVIIDGQVYLPAREMNTPAREAVARAVAALFWGELDAGEAWESDWNGKMDGVRLIVTDGSTSGVSADEFLDLVSARLIGKK